MRIVACLSFFDEPKDGLILCLDSLAQAGVDHVVAMDGRYAAFYSQHEVSPAEQRGAIDAVCRHHKIGSTIFTPPGPWEGQESQKRTWLFAQALAASSPGDWFWNIDADMVATEWPSDLKDRLDATECEAAVVTIHDTLRARMKRADFPPDFGMRCFFRAQPIMVGPPHWLYTNAVDGHELWKGTDTQDLRPALDLQDVMTVEHRPTRSPERDVAKTNYYDIRTLIGFEMGVCAQPDCGAKATERMTIADRVLDTPELRALIRDVKRQNPGRLDTSTAARGLPVGHIEEVCKPCADRLRRRNRKRLIGWGFSPDAKLNEAYTLPGAARVLADQNG